MGGAGAFGAWYDNCMNQNRVVEALGWFGVIAILAAYALHTFSVIDDGIGYQLLNLGGALGIIVSSIDNKNYQPILLNVVWAVIAVSGLVKAWF